MKHVAVDEVDERRAPSRSAVGRSDLLWLLARVSPEEVTRAAAKLGFFEVPRQQALHEREAAREVASVESEASATAPASVPEQSAMPEEAMTFFRVEAATFDDTPLTPAPIPERGLLPEDIESPEGSLQRTPTPTPLVPWSRLWPRLRSALQASVPGRDPDVAALVRAFGRGEELRRVPRTPRRVWASRASVWIDESPRLDPLWDDHLAVCRRLRRVCGAGVQVYVVHGAPEGAALRRDPELPVLVLGDLGAYGSEAERCAWRAAARRLAQGGVRVGALVPSLRAFADRDLPRAWRATGWAGRASAPDAGSVDRLLQLASLALFVQPGLLRDLRLLLSEREADVSTEIELWQHRDVRSADASGLVLHADAAKRLRASLLKTEGVASLYPSVAEVIRRWHEGLPSELLRFETLLWEGLGLAYMPGSLLEDALAFARRAGATGQRARVDRKAAAALRGLGCKVLPLMPDAVYARVPGLDVMWVETFKEASGVRVPKGLDAAGLRAKLGTGGREIWWALRQVGKRLEFRAAGGPAWASAETGEGSPVAMLFAPGVITRGDGAGYEEQVRVEEGVALGEAPGGVVLRSHRGSVRIGAWKREAWAVAAGRDRFGLWADTEINGVIQRFRWIPPGRFLMGSPEGEAGWFSDEGPQHEVTISAGYWLGETPVTQALWEAVMGEGTNPSRFKSAERPVEHVSWDDCQGFMRAIETVRPGLQARFPTEAEWEYACRAGTGKATWVGDLEILGQHNAPLLDKLAWYGGNCGQEFELKNGADLTNWNHKQYKDKKGGTHPVKKKRPNPYGLYDMLGNVWEWCEDWKKAYEATPASDPRGPAVGSYRVFRGGAWDSDARFVRASRRIAGAPGLRNDVLGFRLARGQQSQEPGAEPGPRSGPSRGAGRDQRAKGTGRAQ